MQRVPRTAQAEEGPLLRLLLVWLDSLSPDSVGAGLLRFNLIPAVPPCMAPRASL